MTGRLVIVSCLLGLFMSTTGPGQAAETGDHTRFNPAAILDQSQVCDQSSNVPCYPDEANR